MNRKMKIGFAVCMGISLGGCAGSKPQRIPSVQEATADGRDIENGIFVRKDLTNIEVQVTTLREKAERISQELENSRKEASYYKSQNEELQKENQLLRVRGGYRLEKQVNTLQGFDNQGNPVIRQQKVNMEPESAPEERVSDLHYQQMPVNTVQSRPAPTRYPASNQ